MIPSYYKNLPAVVWLCSVFSLMLTFAEFSSMPYLALYISETLNATSGQVGNIVGLQELFFTLSGVFIGIYLGHISAHKLAFFAITSLAISFSLLGFSESHANFYAIAVLLGFSRCLFRISWNRVFSTVVTAKQVRHALSLRFVFICVGGFLGPVYHMLFKEHTYRDTFLMTGALYAISFFVIYFVLNKTFRTLNPKAPKDRTLRGALAELRSHPVVMTHIFAGVIYTVAFSQMFTTLSLSLKSTTDDFKEVFNSILLTFFFTQMVAQSFVPRLTRTLSTQRVIFRGAFISSLGLVSISFLLSLPEYLLLSVFVLAIGNSLYSPNSVGFITENVSQSKLGLWMGLGQLRLAGISLGSFLGGHLLQLMEPSLTILAIGSLCFVSMGIHFILDSHCNSKEKSLLVKGKKLLFRTRH